MAQIYDNHRHLDIVALLFYGLFDCLLLLAAFRLSGDLAIRTQKKAMPQRQ